MSQSNEKTTMALIKKDIEYIKLELAEIRKELEGKYVTEIEFAPVRNVVYGLVGLILTGVIGALLTLVITR